jgi:hypothetical protein
VCATILSSERWSLLRLWQFHERNEERDDEDDEVGSCDRGREDAPRRGGDSDTQIEAEFG